MSRNFELLKQLEVEVDHSLPLHTEADSLITKHASSAEAVRLFGVETVHLVQTDLPIRDSTIRAKGRLLWSRRWQWQQFCLRQCRTRTYSHQRQVDLPR